MYKISVALTCVATASHGRHVQSSPLRPHINSYGVQGSQSPAPDKLRSLATLLLGGNAAAAFHPSAAPMRNLPSVNFNRHSCCTCCASASPHLKPISCEVAGLEPQTWFRNLKSLLWTTVHRYWISMLLSVISCLLRVYTGHTQHCFFDVQIFKYGLSLAFGFRIHRAMTRRAKAQKHVRTLFSSAWRILSIFSSQCLQLRQLVSKELGYVLDIFSKHITIVALRSNYMLGIIGLQPAKASITPTFDSVWTSTHRPHRELKMSPVTVMQSVLMRCQEEIRKLDDNPKKDTMLREFCEEEKVFKKSYDEISHLACPALSDRYNILIDVILLVFAVCLPWGMSVPDFLTNAILKSCWLVANSGLLMLGFFINSLAADHENPFAGGDIDDVPFQKQVRHWREAAVCYDHNRNEFEELFEELRKREFGDYQGDLSLELDKCVCAMPSLPSSTIDVDSDERGDSSKL